MHKVLILGANGMLGNALFNFLGSKKEYVVYNQTRQNIDSDLSLKFDLNDKSIADQFYHLVSELEFDFIINCIANVDLVYCENNLVEANYINADFITNIAKWCPNTHFIQVSTDSVFDGKKSDYSETDTPNPLNNYTRSKHNAEKIVSNKFSSYTIIRTNIYGLHINKTSSSLVEWALNEWEKNISIGGYDDVFFNPVSVLQLSQAVDKIIKLKYIGIINVCSVNKISKFWFLKILSKRLNINPLLLKESSYRNSLKNHSLIRPLDTYLNPNFLKSTLSLEFTINQGIDQLEFFNYEFNNIK
jgi:dTDP-4-dehydrorhamnose reductase